MTTIKLAQGSIVVEHGDAIVGCIEKDPGTSRWAFHATTGNPFQLGEAMTATVNGPGTLERALWLAVRYRPYGQ